MKTAVNSKFKKKQYQKFDNQSKDSKVKYLNNQKKLITATIMQLKFGHDYFNSYLKNLINYSKISKCYERCHEVQNPNHLLINCSHFRNQQTVLIKNMKSHTQLIKALFTTTKKLKYLIDFLKSTNVATRRWILNEIDQNIDQFGWRELED